MFRRYRCQYEAAQKQSDWTCFASLSRKLRDAKAAGIISVTAWPAEWVNLSG
jgi:hypothetical protein